MSSTVSTFNKGLTSDVKSDLLDTKSGYITMFINSKKYISGNINSNSLFDNISRKKTGETTIRGQYYGSGTRINECGSVYRPHVGFLDMHIKIVEYTPEGEVIEIFDKIINFKEHTKKLIVKQIEEISVYEMSKEDHEYHIKNLLEKISNVDTGTYCPINDFSKIPIEHNGVNFVFRFRQLHRFDNEVEISGVSFF